MKIRRPILLVMLVVAALLASGAVALASIVDVDSVVDTTTPTGSVTANPGDSGLPITINMSVNGNQGAAATFKVYQNWTLSGGVFTGSNPQTFSVPARKEQDPDTTFTATGTISVASGQSKGTFQLQVSAFDPISLGTGTALKVGTSSTYSVTVEVPAPVDNPPSTTRTVSGTLGANGWYTSPVTVHLVSTDADSTPVASIQYALDGVAASFSASSGDVAIAADGVHSLTYGGVDTANNTETVKGPFEFKVDQTAPVIEHNVAGDLGSNGWRVSNATVTFSDSDATSQVDTATREYSTDGGTTWTAYTSAGVVLTDGEWTVLYRVKDNAGNTGTDSVAVKVDTTPPVISGAPDRTPDHNGWYNANVTVSFTATDIGGSGIDTKTAPVTLSTDGANQSVPGTATDMAGNSNSTTVSGISIDKTAPVITILRPTGSYLLNQAVTALWSVDGDISGLASSSGTVASGSLVNTSIVGDRPFSVTATDNAGNTATSPVTYHVGYVFGGILPPFNRPPQLAISSFKRGSTIPVKFQLFDANGNVVQVQAATMPKIVLRPGGSVVDLSEPEDFYSTSAATMGTDFRWDGQQYIYNLNTKNLVTGTEFDIWVQLDDSTSPFFAVKFTLRK